MGRRRRGTRVELVRRLLLAALVVFLGVISAMFYVQRAGSPRQTEAREREEMGRLSDLVRSGEGFQYEVTEKDRKLFNISADKILENRDDLFVLENVAVEIAREDATYQVSASRGTYRASQDDKTTRLEGGATVRSSSGAEVRSEGFELRRKGRLVASTAPVRFRLGERLVGTARNLEAYLKRDRYQLSGNVVVDGGPEDPTFRLRCRRLIYEEQSRRIYAEGDVRLERRGVELNAGRITVTLAETTSEIRFIRAQFIVTGLQRLEDELDSFARFEAHQLSLLFDEQTGELIQSEFDSRRGENVFLETGDATQLARRLTAPRILADFESGHPTRVEAFETVEIKEYLLFAPRVVLLLSCSRSAIAEMSHSGFEEIRLAGGVDLHQLDMQAVGERVTRSAQSGETEVEGRPATIYTARGDLAAPSIIHYSAGRATAKGGVRATMTRGGGFAMIKDSDDVESPIRVTSREASWNESAESVSFKGEVRAWQGEDFIVAEELLAEEGGDRLLARTNVRTVITSRQEDDSEAPAKNRAPVEVSAAEMTYLRNERLLAYSGSPMARQAERTLNCGELKLYFDPSDELERMECHRDVLIEDDTEGRSIRGDLAVYLPGQSRIEVEGRPAILEDPDGAEVRGSVVVYDLDSGRAYVRAGSVTSVTREEGEP